MEAEAELLAAMVMFFKRVGLSSQDVAIKVSSRQLLQAVLEQHHVPAHATSTVFVTVDKMDKLPQHKVSLLCKQDTCRQAGIAHEQHTALDYACCAYLRGAWYHGCTMYYVQCILSM